MQKWEYVEWNFVVAWWICVVLPTNDISQRRKIFHLVERQEMIGRNQQLVWIEMYIIEYIFDYWFKSLQNGKQKCACEMITRSLRQWSWNLVEISKGNTYSAYRNIVKIDLLFETCGLFNGIFKNRALLVQIFNV